MQGFIPCRGHIPLFGRGTVHGRFMLPHFSSQFFPIPSTGNRVGAPVFWVQAPLGRVSFYSWGVWRNFVAVFPARGY